MDDAQAGTIQTWEWNDTRCGEDCINGRNSVETHSGFISFTHHFECH